MRGRRNGFTMIEVALFLVVTGLLFVGVTVGVQNSIFQQRFNDATQGFAEFLRSIYSEVSNVQNLAGGRSEYAIYGKLVTFGESKDLAGCPVNDGTSMKEGCNNNGRNSVFVYDVIGQIGDVESGNTLVALSSLKSNVVIIDDEAGTFKPVGIVDDFVPRWAAQIEDTNFSLFKGALLIVRHPSSGTIYTYVMKGETLDVNDKIIDLEASVGSLEDGLEAKKAEIESLLTSRLVNAGGASSFGIEQVDFCINPEPGVEFANRRDVRIIKGARNASGVEIIATDSKAEGNVCSLHED